MVFNPRNFSLSTSFKALISWITPAGLQPEPVWRGGDEDVVALVDEDGVIGKISRSSRHVIGAAGDFRARSLLDFVDQKDRARVKAALEAAAAPVLVASPGDCEVDFRLLRLRRAPARVSAVFRRESPSEISVLIRERRRSSSEPRKAVIAPEFKALIEDVAAPAETQHEDRAPVEADSAPSSSPISSEVSSSLADLGHEMKTPLNAIIGFAEAMSAHTFGPLGNEKYDDYAGHIRNSGIHLLELVNGMVDRAKIDSGRYVLTYDTVNLSALARECVAMVSGQAEAAGLTMKLDLPADLGETSLDGQVVRQVLINLLSNAVKFTREGEILLAVSRKDRKIQFEVADTGIGMSSAALAKLGGRFTDVHQNGVRGTTGMGLGLSLAQSLARLHGGSLTLSSEAGIGTRARFILPTDREEVLENVPIGDIKSQLDRVNAFRRERLAEADAA